MIAKGTTHNNGAKLAAYMTTSKPGEHADLWQLRGFASGDIKEAFRSVHVIAEATQCQKPLFHVQVRNPEGENLTREQWECVADRIESKLGYSDQPRAIAFHRDEETGHEHMHIAWSRIDTETMTAKPLPFFKLRLKEVCRELETEFDLTPVKNHRDTPVLAPTRDEFEQARRLGVELKAVRETIRECYERSDDGKSFEAALAEKGLTLAKGDRRDYIVIDQEGGIHALGKRVLGHTATETRARLGDLDREGLPTIEQGRDQNTIARERLRDQPIVQAEAFPSEHALARTAINQEQFDPGLVARETSSPALAASSEKELNQHDVDIRLVYSPNDSAQALAAALEERPVRIANVTPAAVACYSETAKDFLDHRHSITASVADGVLVALESISDFLMPPPPPTKEEAQVKHEAAVQRAQDRADRQDRYCKEMETQERERREMREKENYTQRRRDLERW